MTERIKVWPKPGLTVKDEYSKEPIESGAEVPYTRLTIRRLRDGDLLAHDPNDPKHVQAHAQGRGSLAERFGKE